MSSSSLPLRQILLLLWKNIVLQIRRPIGTALELVFPVLALAIIIALRQLTSQEYTFDCFATFQSNFLQVPSDYGTIYYAPNTTNATAIMQFAIQQWPQLNGSLIGVANGTELQNTLMNVANYLSGGVCDQYGLAGVYFDNVDTKDIEYTLRFPYEWDWETDKVSNTSNIKSPATTSSYMTYGFINLQRIVEQSIIAFITQGETTVDVDVSMRQFPYPPGHPDNSPFLSQTSVSLSILLMLAFMYTFACIVKELVIEKDSCIREVMGLRLWVLWTTRFIKQLLFMSIWVIVFPILMKFVLVWPKSDLFLLMIFFLLFVISIIAFGFLASALFKSPRVSFFVSFIIFFLSFVPNFFIPHFNNKGSL
jgi:hypothetical protein